MLKLWVLILEYPFRCLQACGNKIIELGGCKRFLTKQCFVVFRLKQIIFNDFDAVIIILILWSRFRVQLVWICATSICPFVSMEILTTFAFKKFFLTCDFYGLLFFLHKSNLHDTVNMERRSFGHARNKATSRKNRNITSWQPNT